MRYLLLLVSLLAVSGCAHGKGTDLTSAVLHFQPGNIVVKIDKSELESKRKTIRFGSGYGAVQSGVEMCVSRLEVLSDGIPLSCKQEEFSTFKNPHFQFGVYCNYSGRKLSISFRGGEGERSYTATLLFENGIYRGYFVKRWDGSYWSPQAEFLADTEEFRLHGNRFFKSRDASQRWLLN